MRRNPHSCELKDKVALSICEAASLFGIGQTKLQKLLSMPDCPFLLMNGHKRMILKDRFLQYLEEEHQI